MSETKNYSYSDTDDSKICKKLSSNCMIYCADFFDTSHLIAHRSVDMIFADPPYNLSNDGFTCKSGRAASVNKGDWDKSHGIDEDLKFHNSWITRCRDMLTENGTIWITGTYHSIYLCGMVLQSLGFHILNDICWFKPNASPNLSCRVFAASHETIIWARKNKTGKHVFNYELMKNMDFPKDIIKNTGKQMRSVWSIPTPSGSEKTFGKHPTQKPLDLLKRIILSSSNEEDTVFDPFMGSGTTGVVAVEYKRNFIGIEKEKNYFDLSEKRIAKVIEESSSKLIF